MSRILFNVNTQPVIISGAGSKPTIPSPSTLRPNQSGWAATDIMKGEIAWNKDDDIYYYRNDNDKILWVAGNVLKKTYSTSTITLNYNEPEYATISLYETGDVTINLGTDNHDGFTKLLMIEGDDNSTLTFGANHKDLADNAYGAFDNSRDNLVTLFYMQGVVYVNIATV